jgi:mRNA interferase RelE/StbE
VYTLKFTQVAEKQLTKLDIELQVRILAVLERIRIRPFHYVKKLVGTENSRVRVGEYRIIVYIEQSELLILIIDVGHRRNIYK